jgi:hypothetical protein
VQQNSSDKKEMYSSIVSLTSLPENIHTLINAPSFKAMSLN